MNIKKNVFYKHNLLNFTVTHICEHKPTQTEIYDPKISNPSQNVILCTYMHKKIHFKYYKVRSV